ncbi:MAG: alpha/beta fold hydrolase [Anaerolineales bacterium]|nr:alpha/beta fold hydrolase [Anaerolineales bacterium]
MPTAAGLYYFSYEEDQSEHTPILLIHGAGGTHLHWPPEIRRLPDQTVLAPDLPGHGKSEGVGRQTIREYAQTVIEFMDATELASAILVGHSMGSAIALTLAVNAPDRVSALGLIGSGGRLRVSPAILENASNEATFPLAVKTINDWAFGPEANPRLRELASQRMGETRQTVLYGDFLACDNFDLREDLSRISAPSLIIYGTEDKMTPPRYSDFLHKNIPNAELVAIAGAGHMVMLEEPLQVADALAAFIQKL